MNRLLTPIVDALSTFSITASALTESAKGKSTERIASISSIYCMLVLCFMGVIPSLQAQDPITLSDFNLPAQDANGWTVPTPSSDTRLVYVDNVSGSDATGTYYLPSDSKIGSNPQAPVGVINPYKTIAAAYAVTRNNMPDWILLKADGVFNESLNIRKGRSATERSVACSYSAGARPELRTGANQGISPNKLNNTIICGIKFWAHTRDSDGPYFVNYNGSTGLNVIGSSTLGSSDVLIEDCVFRCYTNIVLTGSSGWGMPITRFAFRRCIISGNYSTAGHAQGIYHTGEDQPDHASILLEENTLDHNGWRIKSILSNNDAADGQATIFNHNTYFAGAHGVLFLRNIFMRGSSMGTKWTGNLGEDSATSIVIADNLYIEGELGIGIGGNEAGPRRFKDIVIRDNVLTDIGRDCPTNRKLSWAIETQDWDNGGIYGNLIIHQRRIDTSNTYAMNLSAGSATRGVYIYGNIMADLYTGNGSLVYFNNGANTTALVFGGNILQSSGPSALASYTSGGFTFDGVNQYSSTAAANKMFKVNGTLTDLAGWITATGDTGATTDAPVFPDATRDVESYLASIGQGTTFQQFIDKVYAQSKASWNPQLTAGSINNWIRAGFIEDISPSPVTLVTTELSDAMIGTPYTFQLEATGGTGTYTYSASGNLPPGLSLSTGGLLGGTPSLPSNLNLSTTATDGK